MYKKIVIVALIMNSVPVYAGKRWDSFCGWWKGSNNGPVDPTKFAYGVATHNVNQAVQGAGDIVENIGDLLKDPKIVEDSSYAAMYGGSKGMVYGALSGTGNALRDGAKEHPYVASTVVAGALMYGGHRTYRYFVPSQEELTRQARLNREESEHKTMKNTEDTATELRTCLNTHFRCMEPGKRVPNRCNSPVRRLSLLDLARAETIIGAFNKYKD